MPPSPVVSTSELADLLIQTGHAHHAAYVSTDGTDPEWPMWYSGHLQALLGNTLGRPITRSEIVHLLLEAQRDHEATRSDEPWTTFYARFILEGV